MPPQLKTCCSLAFLLLLLSSSVFATSAYTANCDNTSPSPINSNTCYDIYDTSPTQPRYFNLTSPVTGLYFSFSFHCSEGLVYFYNVSYVNQSDPASTPVCDAANSSSILKINQACIEGQTLVYCKTSTPTFSPSDSPTTFNPTASPTPPV